MSRGGRLIPFACEEGALNMAIDQALLESVDAGAPPTLRFYGWSAPTLSLGYFQAYQDRMSHLESESAACVRRATGGGAILHHHELTYSVAVPGDGISGETRDRLYQVVHRAIAETLGRFGVTAREFGKVGGRLGQTEAFLCFRRRTSHDLVVHGYKILGSAQRRGRMALLQHGSLLLRTSRLAPQLPGVSDLTGRVDLQGLMDGIAGATAGAWGLTWSKEGLSDWEQVRAGALVLERFGAASWLGRR